MKNLKLSQVARIYEQPLLALINKASNVHKEHFDPLAIQACGIMSIKTGNCPEDCAYCPQSGHYKTNITTEKFLNLDEIIIKAKAAKANGATRFCMGAAWKYPPKSALPKLQKIIIAIKQLGLETCLTVGELDENSVTMLSQAGLDYYNHNIDTSDDYYKKIITTRTFADRIKTIENIKNYSKINVCCGGIVGMGESMADRIKFLWHLATMQPQPKSVPINHLAPVVGTPLANCKPLDSFEFVRVIATARILLPKSTIRLSAGRSNMSKEMQALCFLSGANSIWYAQEKIFITSNPNVTDDKELLQQLGLTCKDVN